MIPRFSPDYRWNDLAHSLGASSSTSVKALENRFAERTGQSHALAFRYGRSGIYFLLKALGAKNKKVILPSYTCVVVAHAVTLSGNQPIFLDNAPNRLQPNPMDYLNAIDSDTVMVIPTHLFGLAEETQTLYQEVKKKFPSVFVLQDCAHSFFTKDSTGKVVSAFGDGTVFGMNISKLVNSVFGGMLTLNDFKLSQEVKRVFLTERRKRNKYDGWKSRGYTFSTALAFTSPGYELVSWLSRNTPILDSKTQYFDENTCELPQDYASPMLPFEAEVGHRSLDRFDERIRNRAQIASFYIENLKGLKNCLVPSFSSGHTWSHFPILVPKHLRNLIKEEIERELNLELGLIMDYSVADLPFYQRRGAATCPQALATVDRMLNLPLTFQEGLLPKQGWQKSAGKLCQLLNKKCTD